ncbi:hypothetical protein SAMN05216526_1039 [Ectothiorhodosinus mongolicus]|uniref:GAF domain-containing protein n=1 Tax=Ectothiorhodosinus mongolicus TaxID=233100 RepID=A0A1R3VVZ8_9GAMM|nr:DUF484 family protein [Ectothiorhodosinus mongolicus]ULX56974.1 DUF484 domain-containing protein [Ectothiorhodosinus mongolicus]SIT69249.1 hypothetical protein SAMN05216526_1039 [Ectothiorhodosinus mongolicus]
MSAASKSAKTQASESFEHTLETFLHDNPDFFASRPDLLAQLDLSHPSGGAVSLLERQVSVLRDKSRQLERRLLDLVQVARDNERLSQRMHHLALGLMESESLDATLATTQEQLAREFSAEHVVLRLLGEPTEGMHYLSPQTPGFDTFKDLLAKAKPACGRLAKAQLKLLFDSSVSDQIQSAVVVPLLDGQETLGLLALGSIHADRFHPDMGTLFLEQLGQLVSRAILGCRNQS